MTTDWTDKINILLVDDRPENLTALEAVLDSSEYHLVKASSGQEALKQLFDRDFALILLDVQMPDMDGFETASYIRKRERSKQTPIIFITAISKEERFVFRGYETGAVDYIFKPFEPAILRSKVNVFVDLHRKNMIIRRQGEVLREHERMERERQIVQLELESLRRYQNLADAIPHIVWKAQPNGFVDYANRIWTDYSGLSREQSTGKGWLSSFHPDDARLLADAWTQANRREKGFELECRIKRASDNAYRWHLTRVVPELDFSGSVVAWLCTATDVHERKTAREELEKAKDFAEAANSAKSRFLANISHEIRTPLGAILGFVEIMADEKQEAQDRMNCVNTIRRNGQQLLRIIDEILDLSKIEAGRMKIENVPVDLPAVVTEVRSLLEVQARKKKIDLRVEIAKNLPPTVLSDPTRLRQILTNVVGNSIKFTEKGHVLVEVSHSPREGLPPHRALLRFTVRDTGCGIRDEHKGRLFQPFGQADTTITRKFGGTGLGLTLSRQLARSLGGDLVLVESQIDRGSVFAIEILAGLPTEAETKRNVPVPIPTPSPPPAKAGPRLQGMRILVAEDGPDNRVLITRMLQMNGATVHAVENGEVVVEHALRAGAEYDLILMDIQMPVMNGYDATRKLRTSAYRKPIIALTAYAMKDERERCLGAGCDDYLTKPIDYAELMKKISAISHPVVHNEASRARSPVPEAGA